MVSFHKLENFIKELIRMSLHLEIKFKLYMHFHHHLANIGKLVRVLLCFALRKG